MKRDKSQKGPSWTTKIDHRRINYFDYHPNSCHLQFKSTVNEPICHLSLIKITVIRYIQFQKDHYLTFGFASSVFGGGDGSGTAAGSGAAGSEDPFTLSLADILSLPQLTLYSPDSLQFLTKRVRSFPFDFSS